MNLIKKYRVLLVDDDVDYLKIFSRRLLARNYEVVGEAENGEEAIELFKSEKPDLTLLDYQMPRQNGGEILQEILAINPEALVIMLTGRVDSESMQQSLDKGAFLYIRKDYPPETIFVLIEESLKKFADKTCKMLEP